MRVLSVFVLMVTALSAIPALAGFGGYSYTSCTAYTACPWGGQVNCTTLAGYTPYGPQACTWFVQPGAYVQCTGFDNWGRWGNFVFRCY